MFQASALRQSNYDYERLQLPIALTKGQRLKHQLFYPLQWLIYVFNPVVNTKLPAILSHQCSTKVSLETYPFIQYSLQYTQVQPRLNINWL